MTNRHDTSLDVDGKVLDGPAVIHFPVLGLLRTRLAKHDPVVSWNGVSN